MVWFAFACFGSVSTTIVFKCQINSSIDWLTDKYSNVIGLFGGFCAVTVLCGERHSVSSCQKLTLFIRACGSG